MATKQQSELLKAVIDDNLFLVKQLLQKGVDPNFFGPNGVTPLREAIRNNNIKMVRTLVQHHADVNFVQRNRLMPLDHAEDMAAVTNDYDIVRYLKSKKALSSEDMIDDNGFPVWMNIPHDSEDSLSRRKLRVVRDGEEPPKKKKEPAFTADTLKDVFNPEAWVGKLSEMDKLWDKVPPRLKKNFDFAAQRAEASRQTIKKAPKGPKMPPV